MRGSEETRNLNATNGPSPTLRPSNFDNPSIRLQMPRELYHYSNRNLFKPDDCARDTQLERREAATL